MAGASSYGIGVVDDTIGVKIVNVDFGIAGTSYTISSSLIKAGHSYRYSVGAIAADGTQKWVENLTFRVKNPTLTAPIITYPSNGAYVEPGSVTIRWTGVSGATTYLLAFKDLTSGMKYLDDQDVGNRTSYTISTGLIMPGHSYKIALCAKNDAEEKWTESTFSIKEIAVKSLTPPVIYSPRNGETLEDPGSVTVRWSSVDGATKYLIAVMDITDGDKFVNDQDIGTSTSYTIPSYRIKPGHKYKIAVCARNEREEKWTEATFSIKASEDTTPPRISGFSGRLEVEQGQSVSLPGTITSSTNITKVTIGVWGYQDNYASKYPNSKTFSMSSFVINTSSGLFSQPGEYVLTVWASSVGCPNPERELGRMTLVVRETRPSGPQAPPVIISPTNGGTYEKGDISIRWSAVSGATHYVVAVLDVTSGQKIVNDENVGSRTSYTLRESLLTAGHRYKIGVGAVGNGVEKWNTDTYITVRDVPAVDTTPPRISGFSGRLEVEQGQSVSLPGTITSSTNITKVTIGVWGYQDNYASKYPNSKTFSMSSFVINTSSGLFSQPGEYVLTVWASSVGCPNPERELGRMTLVVREPKVLLAKPVIKYPGNGETLKKDSLTVRWDSVPGAASYGIGVWDITTDEKIVDIGNGWKQTSYTIPSAKLEEGHSYKIAVGAISADGKTENWNDEGIRVTIAKPEVPVLTGFPAADQVIAGDKYTFKGRITCKSKLTKVTINLRGQSGDLWSRQISTDTFDLSSVTVDTSQGILAYPGTYIINVWAATADWQPTEPLKSMTLTVKAPSPPALKGFPANQTRTITLGDTYSLEGYLTADCPITRVNAVVIGANTLSGIKEIAEELQGSIKTYNLNRLKIDTKLPEFSAAKRYEIRLWAKTERFQNPEVPLAIMWLEVKLGDAPQIENLPNSVDVLKGETYRIRGRVVSQSDLTKVTAIMKPKDHAGALGTFAPKIFTEEIKDSQKTFDLSKFEIDTGSLLSGAYTIDIYAKSIANNVAEAPLGTMVLNVKSVLPPTIKDFEQYRRITVGEEYTLKGIITSTSTLTKVTAQIAGDASSVQSRDNLNTKNYSLNTFTFKPDKPGIYLVEVWAATKYLGKPTEPIGQMILDVRPKNELLGPNNNVNGYKVFGFPLNKRIELFTGETYCFQGMLYSDTPLYLVNLKISGPQGNGIDNDAFRQDVKGNVFDFRKYQFAALDRFAVPGDYKIDLWASAEGKQPEMLGSCTITVKSPTKWIDGPRYLDERDEVYVSLEVDEGIKKNGTYPIIAVRIFEFNGDEEIGYYTLNQVKDNHFERYIPATELRRSSSQARTLRFNIMVDGYDPWYAKVNPNPKHVKTLTVPEAKWRIPVGGQQFKASATSDYLVVNVPTNHKLPSSYKVCMGVSADNKTWKEYPIPAKGNTYFSHSYRLGDLGLQRGSSYYFRATIYGPNNVVIDQTKPQSVLIPTKPVVQSPQPMNTTPQGQKLDPSRVESWVKKVTKDIETFRSWGIRTEYPSINRLLSKGSNITPEEFDVLMRASSAYSSIKTMWYENAMSFSEEVGQSSEELIKSLVFDLVVVKMLKKMNTALPKSAQERINAVERELENTLKEIVGKLDGWGVVIEGERVSKAVDKFILFIEKKVASGLYNQAEEAIENYLADGHSIIGRAVFNANARPTFEAVLKEIDQYVGKYSNPSSHKALIDRVSAEQSLDRWTIKEANDYYAAKKDVIWTRGIKDIFKTTKDTLDLGVVASLAVTPATAGASGGLAGILEALSLGCKAGSYFSNAISGGKGFVALRETLKSLREVPGIVFADEKGMQH
ncbi:MAG: fibronectin type III domain-containing protein [Firmicutes bacterium]|nr:fibronectin type III domain-containing protein [Bacillota bacterium]